jgi:predicted membrane channel-forming protein YqfA (hemolysin III family)
MIHNETMNIWTHLLAAIIVAAILGYFLWSNTPQSTKDNIKL